MGKKLIIYTDGGSRGNPGPAAAGVVIQNEQGEVIKKFGKYLEEQTNNYAEYYGIIEALKEAKNLDADEIELYTDSKLVAQQLNQNWRVKDESIQSLFVKAWNLIQQFDKFKISHIKREDNTEADQEVNKILDQYHGEN